MTQRFGLLCALAATTALLLACAVSARAAAEDPPTMPVPADAPTVASTAFGASIIAWLRGEEVCTVLVDLDAPRPLRASIGGGGDTRALPPGVCFRTPATSRFDGGMFQHVKRSRTIVAWGYGGLDTAEIALKTDGRVVASATTGPSALLPAPASELRFWAMEVEPQRVDLDSVAMLDATGVVRRAVAPVDFSASTLLFPARPSPSQKVRRTLLRQGRTDHRRWRLWDEAKPALAPTPLLPERLRPQHCLVLELAVRARWERLTGEALCEENLTAGMPMVAAVDGNCAVGTHVEVVARATVRRVVVVLGDGTRRTLSLAPLGDDLRGGALIVGRGMAVRRALALGADGRTLVVQPLAASPSRRLGDTDCAPAWTAFTWAYLDHLPPVAGAPVPQIVDHGVELCATVGAAPRIPEDCAVPPTDPAETSLHVLPTSGGRYLFGIVPAEIAAARIGFADGTTRTVPAGPLPGYTGLYAGVVRAIAVDLPGSQVIDDLHLVDDRGRVLERSLDGVDPHPYGPVATVLGAAGGAPAVVAAPVRTSGPAATCIGLGTLRRPEDCIDAVAAGGRTGLATAWVRVLCAPRRSVVTVVLRRRSDQLVVRTAGRREVRARSAPFPAAAGPAGRGLRFARAVLGPRDGVDTLIVRGRRAQRFPQHLPPAGRQCGYADGPGFWLALGDE